MTNLFQFPSVTNIFIQKIDIFRPIGEWEEGCTYVTVFRTIFIDLISKTSNKRYFWKADDSPANCGRGDKNFQSHFCGIEFKSTLQEVLSILYGSSWWNRMNPPPALQLNLGKFWVIDGNFEKIMKSFFKKLEKFWSRSCEKIQHNKRKTH